MEVRVQNRRSAHERRRRRLMKRRVRALCLLLVFIIVITSGGILLVKKQAARKNLLAHRQAGIALMQEENFNDAIAEFDEAVKGSRNPGKVEADVLKYRAEAEYRQGDYEAALHTYEILREKDEKDSLLLKMNCICLARLGRYEEALSLGGADAEVYADMAAAALKADDARAALEDIEKGILAAGEDKELQKPLRFNEAVAYEKMSDFKKALELFTTYRDQYGSDEIVEKEIAFLSTR